MIFFAKNFKNLSITQIKEKTRILFIDDQSRDDIIDYLKEEGWTAHLLKDTEFKAIDNSEIKDHHIICVDIKGVGIALKKEKEGLDIAVSIKKNYPHKKVILYSSQATHDIFHEANDLIDKRIYKSSGDFEVFKDAIEVLGKEIFNWENMVLFSYNKYKEYFPADVTIEKYKKIIQKLVATGSINVHTISKKLSIAANIAQILHFMLQVFSSK